MGTEYPKRIYGNYDGGNVIVNSREEEDALFKPEVPEPVKKRTRGPNKK